MELFKDNVTNISDVEVEAVMAWVQQGMASRRKTINRRITSYGLKHVIERDMGLYISNNACIAGLKQMGFTAKPITGTPNYYFNISLTKH